jgi:prepilin-type N-terminal cleavage/methylation domain-containing protein
MQEGAMQVQKNQLIGWSRQKGFTLLEMLIAVVVLGILAMIIVPQITVSSEDAKVSTLKTNLSMVRSATETYYQQHNNVYPGAIKNDGSGAVANAAEAAAAFTAQMATYSEVNGKASSDSATLAAPIYGPYMKGGALPTNPFNNLATVKCDITTTDISAAKVADNGFGWQFIVKTGQLFPSDTGSTGGTAHVAY